MRKGLAGFIIPSLLMASGALVLASEPTSERRAPNTSEAPRGVATLTDGSGNPMPPDASLAAPRPVVGPPRNREPVVQRGQGWWPYPTPLPPYTAVELRAEAMTEDQIQVNGVAILNVRSMEAALQQVPHDLLIGEGGQLGEDDGFYLVKIAGFTRNQPQVSALKAAGAVLGEYLNINTYIARIPSTSVASVRALPFVTFVGDYHPAYKISPRIGLEEIPTDIAYDPATGSMNPWVFEVTLHGGADLEGTLKALEFLGIVPTHDEIISNDAMTVILVRSLPDAVPSMAKIPGVKWIAEKGYPILLASSTSPSALPMLLQNNGVFTTDTSAGWRLWNAGIRGDASGTAQIITIMDGGLNTAMEHFSQDAAVVGSVGPSHRKVIGYDVFNGDVCTAVPEDYPWFDHGTFVSQYALGSISNMATNPDTTHTPNSHWDNGIAPNAKLYFQDVGLPWGRILAPVDLGPSMDAAIAKGSFIQNYSWGRGILARLLASGVSQGGTYDSWASFLDAALVSRPDFVVTTAAGNSGTAGTGTVISPCLAKNSICVGGVDAANPDFLFEDCNADGNPLCFGASDWGSSRGPVATSQRVKPDICTYMSFSTSVGGEIGAGENARSMCQTDATKTVYWDWVDICEGWGGTSFTAPQVAGLAALVRDYFLAGFYPTGVATPGDAITPSGSLVKAMILASGEDLAATAYPTATMAISKRYSSDVGYGRANLPSVLHIGSGPPFLWIRNNDALGDEATKTFYYSINGNGTPLRVMMTYYDSAGNALQKDCDLKVTIGSNVYWGNNFTNGWSTTDTAIRDHTNPSEGVFLDAAHGLPVSGTVRVDIIGYNNPAGMDFSLVVTGDVASTAVKQVSLGKGKYSCIPQTVVVTVNDATATSPVSVLLKSRNSAGAVIDTKTVSCTGSGGVFTGTISTTTGIAVADGGSLVASYDTASPVTARIVCQLPVSDAGFLIQGGCDNDLAGADGVVSPLHNGGVNEYYNKYMDGGEYSLYTLKFANQSGLDLTDVSVGLSFSGTGASKMTVYNSPVRVGAIPVGGVAGAVFKVYTDPTTGDLTPVDMNFDIVSPADGYTSPKRLLQVQMLQANDTVSRQASCATFDTGLAPFYESAVTGRQTNPWRWSTTQGGETRSGACAAGSPVASAMVGGSDASTNFSGYADSFLLLNFQPALRGNAPNGQPYHYVWKWHSFYHASEACGNATGAWAAFYNDTWNSPSNPTGDQAAAFPISSGYYNQTVFDYPDGCTSGTWNWDSDNTGIADDPRYEPTTGGAPNQFFVTFAGVSGLATNSTYFAYGHEHLDLYWRNGIATTDPRDIALDNDRLVYDEYYATGQSGAACGAAGQVGRVGFDRQSYDDCPNAVVVLSVMDADAVSPIIVSVTSPGTGDGETLTLTGTAPYFSGTLAIATTTGRGNNNGVLFVLPGETISATYDDTSPVGSTTAYASTGCSGGTVTYLANTQISDNGDHDGLADNNETVTIDITIRNDTPRALTNTKVTIFSDTPSVVDCISDNQAAYGTIAPGAMATSPSNDRFTFHVAPSVACTAPGTPPIARFTVVITADDFHGSSALQTFTIDLDLDDTGTSTNYTQNFNSDPGWEVSATPDEEGCSSVITYTNTFHWCAACGKNGAGYGAWIGDAKFGGGIQNYADFDSSTLYSPVFLANGSVTLRFDLAYHTEALYDGAIVQYRLGLGPWVTLPFVTPPQSATTSDNYCSPLPPGVTAWTGSTVQVWTTTNAASVPSTAGERVQFRWRLGSDANTGGVVFGGYGVDNVTVTGLKSFSCESTRNTGLPSCPACSVPSGLAANTATDLDPVLDAGVQTTWERDAGNWGDGGSGTRGYDVLRGGTPIALGLTYGTTLLQDNTGMNGSPYAYAVRYRNGCGQSATTPGASAVDWVDPGETAAGFGAGNILEWTGGKTTLIWPTNSNAVLYKLYRGVMADLPRLLDGSSDSCIQYTGAAAAASDLSDVPATGDLYWFVAVSVNGGGGEGGAGFGTFGPRIVNSTGTCP